VPACSFISVEGRLSVALTQRALQDLLGQGFDKFYTKHEGHWRDKVRSAYQYASSNLPPGQKARVDDVAQVLLPILEVDEELRDFLQERKLTQKYWVRYFGDYILDKVWAQLASSSGKKEGA
jgi:predicted outer membrane protein